MSRPKRRDDRVTFHKDQNAIMDREIARCFNDNGGRLFFAPCPEGKRFAAAVTAVMDRVLRPYWVKASQWRQLVWLRMKSFEHQGVLQFGARGNVVWLSERKTKALVQIDDTLRQSRGKPKAYRHGRRNYRNKQPFKPIVSV